MKLLSFDIEISDIFDLLPGEDLDKYSPFHTSIASTAVMGGEEILWYSTGDDDTPLPNITKEKARELLQHLAAMQDDGYMVCAWNGLKFDLQWIGYAADDMEMAAKVALKSYDPMFQFFNRRGFPVSLKAVGTAMGIEQEKLMDGADAPKEWKAGNYQAVMDYVMGDSQITNQIVSAIAKKGRIVWITKKGYMKSESVPRLKTVEEVLKEPEPDQSWMDTPLKRGKFIKWIPESVLNR